ncbi:hypothetical protein VNO77_16658 [Canavalia gladiata]|uniref:Uncharacterized protein n=1 Tax=Canavalia gladiata TaxID=3824 RepID=A0AAN9QFT9_CANGL
MMRLSLNIFAFIGIGTDCFTYHELFGLHMLPVWRSRDLFRLQFLDVYHHVMDFLCMPCKGNDGCNVSNVDASDGYIT